jgi:quinol monooxygenase YgiN
VIVVAGTVRLDPAKREVARAEMAKMITASRAEDGCVSYSYSVDVLDPHVVHVFEVWRDQETLQRHFQTPHLAAWRATWASVGISDRKLSLYEVGSVKPL